MTQFQKYRNKETGEIVEAFQCTRDAFVLRRMPNGWAAIISKKDFNNNYELIKDND